jgi:hypothetical protein
VLHGAPVFFVEPIQATLVLHLRLEQS